MDASWASRQRGDKAGPSAFLQVMVWQEWLPWAQARSLWGSGPSAAQALPIWPIQTGQSPEPRMGSAPAIALWDSEVVGPSSHFQVTPAPQTRPERAPRPPSLPHMRAENQATKSCVPQPSPLLGASVDLCLPALTLSYSRNLGLCISHPHPLGQGASPFCLPLSPAMVCGPPQPTGAQGFPSSHQGSWLLGLPV